MKKFFFSLILIITAVFATENQKAIIIFDASGSMWGQIDGKAKIEIARDALKNVINEWNPKVQLGLTVYGHRKKGDCNDIESLIPVGEIDKKKVISTVFAIKPKGKTPISRSIKKAAEELKYTEEKATIILISDGKETCDTNPCGVAKELKEKGIDFVTHVIGFNVDKKTDKQLKCIATATGGEYFSAKNASALNKAIKAIAKKVEKIEPTPTPTKKHTPKVLKNNLEVTASEKEGGKWIRAYISNIRTKDDKYIASGYDTYKNKPHEFRFPVGKYTLDMSYNKFKKTKIPFEIKAGEVTKLHIVMGETGVVEVTASEKEGGKWVRAHITNIRTEDGEYVNSGYDTYKNKPHEFRFPIGKYTLDMSYKEFKKTKIPFEIKAGKVTKLHVSFAPLHLSVKGTHKCAMVSYEVISAKGRVVTEKQAPANKGLDLVLPNGTYFIESTINGVTKKTKIVVGGENATKEAIIDFGGKDTKDGINGEWRLGSQKVIIHLNGTKVTGTIANGDNHRFKGEMTYPQRFNGFWIENGSNEKCSTTKQGSYYWGKVTWEFEDDMCSFTGKWNYCTKKPTMNGGKFIFIKPLPKEPTKEELIKADTPSKTQIAEEKHQKEDTKSNTEELDIKGVSQKDLENAKKLIDTLGGLFGNPNNSK